VFWEFGQGMLATLLTTFQIFILFILKILFILSILLALAVRRNLREGRCPLG